MIYLIIFSAILLLIFIFFFFKKIIALLNIFFKKLIFIFKKTIELTDIYLISFLYFIPISLLTIIIFSKPPWQMLFNTAWIFLIVLVVIFYTSVKGFEKAIHLKEKFCTWLCLISITSTPYIISLFFLDFDEDFLIINLIKITLSSAYLYVFLYSLFGFLKRVVKRRIYYVNIN